MYRYAQIDETRKCICVSELSGEVSAPHMIPILETSKINTGDTYTNGLWTRRETTRIDDSNVADVNYELDFGSGEYIEVSRTTRNEPLPPPAPTLEERTAALEAMMNIIFA